MANSSNAEPQLLVADSFRVRVNPRTDAAEVRGLDEHLRRFTGAVIDSWPGAAERDAVGQQRYEEVLAELRASDDFDEERIIFAVQNPAASPIIERVDAFLDEALPQIAAYGEGFPRLELWGDTEAQAGEDLELRLSLRPLPELRDTISLRTASGVILENPGMKGPNIARLTELNRELGAEALLTDSSGRVLEGATTSLIWWTDDTDESGHYVEEPWAEPANRVPSVTESLLVDAAQKRLVGTKPNRRRNGALREGRPRPEKLTGYEVWAVNALHGIRPVTSIDGVPLRDPEPRRLKWFREALDRTWQPVAPSQ